MNENGNLSPTKRALMALKELKQRLAVVESAQREPIAIIGMGCRFPGGANTPADFWQLMCEGRDGIVEVPASRWNGSNFYDPNPETPGKMVTRYGGFIEQIESFDPLFFNMSPREAECLDPQQRLMMEVSYEALEDACQPIDQLFGRNMGVFIGACTFDNAIRLTNEIPYEGLDGYFGTGNSLHALAGRLSFLYGVNGPSMVVDTACSSSLVSVHLACLHLRSGQCDMALAGGVNAVIAPEVLVSYSRTRAIAADGRCKTFSADADGFVRSDGCGVVVLKRLSDAMHDGDRVLAVIRGSAVNQDGPSGGLTVPNGPAQEAVIKQALENAGVDSAEISYIEAHGSGTALGDPIEVGSLSNVLGKNRQAPIWLGAVKTNIGHTEGAAGIAGLIKSVLAIQHQQIPPNLHFAHPNPLIAWDEAPLAVPTKIETWQPANPTRTAGVSAFGLSGTNVHVIVSEPELANQSQGQSLPKRSHHLLTLSAKSDKALRQLAGRWAIFLSDNLQLSLAHICWTANAGRRGFAHRAGFVVSDSAELRHSLTLFANQQPCDNVVVNQVKRQSTPPALTLHIGEGDLFSDVVDYFSAETNPATFPNLLKGWLPFLTIVQPRAKAFGSRQANGHPTKIAPTIQIGEDQTLTLNADTIWHDISTVLATCYTQAISIDWYQTEHPTNRQWLSLPPYPFQRKRYWLEGDPSMTTDQTLSAPDLTDTVTNGVTDIISELLRIPSDEIDPMTPLLEMGADSIILLDLTQKIQAKFSVEVAIRQLFEELIDLDALADFIAENLPVGWQDATSKPAAAAVQVEPVKVVEPEPEPVLVNQDSAPQPVTIMQPAQQIAPLVQQPISSIGASDNARERIMRDQLQVMSQLISQQLAVLGNAPAPTTIVRPAPINGNGNGKPIGKSNGKTNGYANGHSNGIANGSTAEKAIAKTPSTSKKSDGGDALKESFNAEKATRTFSPQQAAYLAQFTKLFNERTSGSKQFITDYRPVWADVRTTIGFRQEMKEMCYSIVADRSQGGHIWDLNGHKYVDIAMGFGVHMFGHNPQFVVEAVRDQLGKGMHIGPQANIVGDVSEKLAKVTGMERVTFANSGTEAVATAIRLARAATGKTKILFFNNSYHGHADVTLAISKRENGVLKSVPWAPGVPQTTCDDTIILDYDSDESLEIIRQNLDDLAAVLVEPVQSRRPDCQPKAFLQAVRKMTADAGVPLIFDEIVNGFRIHPRGAQGWFDISADIATYGKVIGGGMPIGIVAGKNRFIDRIDGGMWQFGDDSYPQVPPTFAAGTFCKHPLTLAAVNSVLNHIDTEGMPMYDTINRRTDQLSASLNSYFESLGITLRTVNCGSIFRFTQGGNFSYVYQPFELELFYYHMLSKGIYLWEGRTCFISTAHDEADFERIEKAARESAELLVENKFYKPRKKKRSA